MPITASYTPGVDRGSANSLVRRIVVAWTSDSSGNASGSVYVNGVILRAAFKPGSGGNQPTNGYAMTLTDYAGLDVLAGQGASLSNASASHKAPLAAATDGTTQGVVPIAANDDLTLSVSGAGNTKSGELILYVR